MKIHPDKTRSYVQCKHCPDLQLTPQPHLGMPNRRNKVTKNMVPLRDSLWEYSPDAPRIAEAVIKTLESSDIYCIYSWTREQQQQRNALFLHEIQNFI
ncbi:hypothetical protein TNCV_2912071 [Trichonephila clavipes]|nr:hypothetical protein TNCV_2912071 [Trichonephila clavipes]